MIGDADPHIQRRSRLLTFVTVFFAVAVVAGVAVGCFFAGRAYEGQQAQDRSMTPTSKFADHVLVAISAPEDKKDAGGKVLSYDVEMVHHATHHLVLKSDRTVKVL